MQIIEFQTKYKEDLAENGDLLYYAYIFNNNQEYLGMYAVQYSNNMEI